MKKQSKKIAHERSGGNVFEDIGASPEEAQNLLIRSRLMLRLRDVISDRKLTQARAAKLFGVTQPRVSDLVRGRVDRFSVDSLIAMLDRAAEQVFGLHYCT